MQCSKCANHPTMKRSKEDAPSFTISGKNCYACGSVISADGSFFYCETCKNGFLCDTCRVCTENHFLSKVVNLENLDSGYEGNSYCCNVCSADRVVTDNGIWHCNPCCYDVCEKCLE